MSNILRNIIVTIGALMAFASAHAQEDMKLLVGADFDMYFDNREYIDCQFGESQTLFCSRLTPTVGGEWNK